MSGTTQSGSGSPAQTTVPLLLEALGKEQRQGIVRAAARWVADRVCNRALPEPQELLPELAQSIVMGAFVTLKRGEILRGCCGVLGKAMALGDAVRDAAVKTARDDRRMAPISPCELPFLHMDVTLLGPFQRVQQTGRDRIAAVEVGRHGLMIQHGQQSGLLLPSVAVERGWNAEKFLQAVCTKAGLPMGAWENADTQLFLFEGHAMGGPLAEFLPEGLPRSLPLPLTETDLAEYARVAGENIVALVSGGAPSYIIPHLSDLHVNALVLSMHWSNPEAAGSARSANAIQFSIRPGLPLQSTLYQMCQQTAAMFQRQGFSGELRIGLTLGFDPAMHGFGAQADLAGVDSADRAVVIADARHCGFAFDPARPAEELLDELRQRLPIGSRDAAVHSMQVISTMPRVISISMPTPVSRQGVRPPAVAGKFYPAEDAARRELVDRLVKGPAPHQLRPLAVMVPHAGLKYSGKIAANVWRRIEDLDGRTLVIVGPKHTPRGVNWAVCPCTAWSLSQAVTFENDLELAQTFAARVEPLQLDAAAHAEEHGIEVQLPFLERFGRRCKVVGLALGGGSWPDIRAAAEEFADAIRDLQPRPLLVISSDMNHYAPDEENRRLDRLALDAMATGDPQHLIDVCRQHEISMCGVVPAALIM
ncbi:MAG: AmmeMemoRadiSam system protein B, partial [Planctomycetota bacterium]